MTSHEETIALRAIAPAATLADAGAGMADHAALVRALADAAMRAQYVPPAGYRLVPAATAAEQSACPGHYLSGPMTGIPEHNYPAFNAAAKALREAGINVVNPAELCANETNWQKCMRLDIAALAACGALVLLPGWESSAGAHLELHLAHRLGMHITTLRELVDNASAERWIHE